jgi:3D (Asp-Asp-Asp) domain-containing protein
MTLRALLALTLCAICHAAEGRWITVEATAYCPCEICCEGSADGITADGTRTNDQPYGVAASRTLALGSIVRIPVGYGYLDETRATARDFRIDDRGGALDSEYTDGRIPRLDLRYRTHWSARQFGRKLMLVFITN